MYAQGTDIHVAPGQERHLPHEAWHVVQQAQGRVTPTTQLEQGTPVNDDDTLEREADVMGAKALAAPVQRVRAVIQMGGGSHYWRRQLTPNNPVSPHGPWQDCAKYDSHDAATAAMKKNRWTTNNGWEFKQGDKKNPPGQ